MLRERLAEPRRFIQVVAGPRQVGKTTLVSSVVAEIDVPVHFVSADEPTLRGPAWLAQQWETARAADTGRGVVLVVDEIQKVERWSETTKQLWDEDGRKRRRLKVVVLGSAPLLIQHRLAESLAGRFEVLHLPIAAEAATHPGCRRRRWRADREGLDRSPCWGPSSSESSRPARILRTSDPTGPSRRCATPSVGRSSGSSSSARIRVLPRSSTTKRAGAVTCATR
ncbi:MAG: AAA family ATPase [Planctomycetes bacterium]|nr:AAA family ATPase [Planctomycetota bacterium]